MDAEPLFVTDDVPSRRFPLYCRGNVGEVYPNVVTPMSASLLGRAAARGQQRCALRFGMISAAHVADGSEAMTGVFGGYMYGNVSIARVAAARAPGMTAADIDRELFGLSDAPSTPRQRGDRSLRGSTRLAAKMGGALFAPRRAAAPAGAARAEIDTWLPTLRPATALDLPALIERAGAVTPWFERMMFHLMATSAFAGLARNVVEQLVAPIGEPGLANVLTAGLGTIESAQPAGELWLLGRMAAADPALAAAFDAGPPSLHDRLRAVGSPSFDDGFARFLAVHGARGPDEWELASPTWGSEPSIALAAIDRLRHAPDERSPLLAAARLAGERTRRLPAARRAVGPGRRAMFDRAVRAAAWFAAEREATKAAFMRVVEPSRQALAEIARRTRVPRDRLFLVRFDELDAFVADPASMADVLDARAARRDELQARIPPFWFDGTLPPPSTWPLRADRLRPDHTSRTLRGLGVCPGVASGRARVVLDPARPGDLQPDDVLVAPITDPAWTPLFLAVAAVVVDVGAQLSHAAIVARELGIPAVVSVTDASRTIADGTWVTVDGSTGTVTIGAGPTAGDG